MAVEISVRLSTAEKRMTKKVLDYSGEIHMSAEDPFIRSLIEEGVKEFGEEPDDVVLTAKMTV